VLAAFLGEDCLSEVASSAAAANTELRATGSNTNHPGGPNYCRLALSQAVSLVILYRLSSGVLFSRHAGESVPGGFTSAPAS